MKNKLKKTTSMLCALTVAAVPMTMSAFTASASYIHLSDTTVNTESDYTLTIPSSFTVANAGWNEIEDGVKASGTLADGKKLVVTAESDNNWALKSGDNAIGYNLAKAEADYNANAEVPTWEFDTLTADGVSQTAGLIVDNYDEAPAGNYSDNVVFTAGVEDAVTLQTFNSADLTAGTILHIGDKIEVGSTILDFYGWGLPANNTYTLVRVNATETTADWYPDITESDDGAYYTFKYISDGETKYQPEYVDGMPKATNTSDGVIVEDIGQFAPKLSTHEP